jgi:hypothetical protein
MEESMVVDPAHSAPSYSAMNQSETAFQHSVTASSATSESSLLEPRFLKLIRSNEIRRYDDHVTM